MPKCSFCSKNIPENEGLMFIKNDAKIKWYCSSKCRKNSELGRIPRKVKWVKGNKA